MTTAELLPILKSLHERIRESVVEACEQQSVEQLATISRDDTGDTLYAVDVIGEALLIEIVETEIASRTPVVLIAEGLEEGQLVLPRGAREADATLRIIVDPIDGTRCLMYQKRPAWILTGVAPNKGPETSLADIELAVMTEIPLVKQHLYDVLWAFRGEGAHAERVDRKTGARTPLPLRPSRAPSIDHGFAQVSRFVPGGRADLAAIDDEICSAVLGPVRPQKAQCFEDQYISSGGQLYELIVGHDRFVAELRPLTEALLRARGIELGICCHPYDLCTELIAREAGVVVCKPGGEPLDARLSVEPDVAWVGYANASIRAVVEPALHAALAARGIEP
jgi:fructose-1,6-bisphosphatase/inositol monophosphatase family enzyme